MGVVTFFAKGADSIEASNQLSSAIARMTLEDGFLALSTTVIRSQTVLRMCVTNPRASKDDIRQSIERLGKYLERVARS